MRAKMRVLYWLHSYEPRLGSANRDSQHIRDELNIPISSGTFERLFSTLRLARSVSSSRTNAFWGN